MIELNGKYNTAKVFTDNVDKGAVSQIIELCNQEFLKESKIRIMPDTHVGKACTIGTSLTIKDKIVPNLVGVDIGCGMLTVKLGDIDIDFKRLDIFIRDRIPSGFKVNKKAKVKYAGHLEELKCIKDLSKSTGEFNKALGSLGGGNHFIEINEGKNKEKYLVIHSGSRNLGKQVAEFYQKKAIEFNSDYREDFRQRQKDISASYKGEEIEKKMKDLKEEYKNVRVRKELCYLEGFTMKNYLYDMKIVQKYADLNREVIAKRIIEEGLNLQFKDFENFQTIHNYIDLESMILRKGAISAKEGERVLIPINMRDGSLICIGKGNPDWNFSAPHGAGRLMSRSNAKESFNLEEFEEQMKDVYTSSVKNSTLDEVPMAYKPMAEIIENIKDTVEIVDRIKVLYNFKA